LTQELSDAIGENPLLAWTGVLTGTTDAVAATGTAALAGVVALGVGVDVVPTGGLLVVGALLVALVVPPADGEEPAAVVVPLPVESPPGVGAAPVPVVAPPAGVVGVPSPVVGAVLVPLPSPPAAGGVPAPVVSPPAVGPVPVVPAPVAIGSPAVGSPATGVVSPMTAEESAFVGSAATI
jgi:hypothetical protein